MEVNIKLEIIREIFPKVDDNWKRHVTATSAPPFTIEDLQSECDKLKTRKAGLDRIPPETIKLKID